MDKEERANFEGQILELKEALGRCIPDAHKWNALYGLEKEAKRIADALERLLKYTEMNL